MNLKRRFDDWLLGWVPKEPLCQKETKAKAKKADGPSIIVAFTAYCAIYLSIVYPVLFLTDFFGLSLVYKVLAGAAAAGLAGAVGNLVLKPWRKAREIREK